MVNEAETTECEIYDGSTPLRSVKQEMFVNNFMQGMTKWDAYRKAGYRCKNATCGAIQLLKNKNVAVRIAYRRADLQAQMQAETGITEAAVLEEIRRLAFSNMQDFIEQDEEGNIIFRDFEQISRDKMAAVESVKITKTTTTNRDGSREYTTQHTQFKLHPKTANLEELGKHLGIFEADNLQRSVQFQMLKFEIHGDKDRDNFSAIPERAVLQGSGPDVVAG